MLCALGGTGELGRGRASGLVGIWDLRFERGWFGGAGRRTPCAGRAVILTAVQSLRRACGESASTEMGRHPSGVRC